ncbi:MAG: class I adenylate-forming enzyme family protein [Roseobacter sp.]
MNPAVWLARTAQAHPTAPALFLGTQCVADYATFATRAAAIGASLARNGIGAGDRVALFMANCPEYLEILYGAWWIGAAVVPINGKLHAREAAWILDNAQASVVFADAATAQSLKPLVEADIITVGTSRFEALFGSTATPAPAPRAPDDLAWLFYTSGTTGTPKGVMITCGNIASMALSYFVDVDPVMAEDAILYAAPMSHGAGLYNFMHVMRGARHVIPASGGFDAREVLTLAPQVGPVSMFAAPTMVRRLVDTAKADGQNGEGLRTIVYAGGPMYEADIIDATTVMGARFVQIYGQGECPMGITALSRADVADRVRPGWAGRLNSVGRPQTEVEVSIVDAQGMPLAPGDSGEIVVRGRTVMAGYWRNPKATAETLRDGWLWTGDMGRMDAESYVTLQDRSKDVIITGGSNVYPREVEEVLLRHAKVKEVSVVGQEDTEWGEIIVAFVVPEAGADVTPEALDQLCLDAIARFKRPKQYIFCDALPKNNYGKVLKTDLRKRLTAQTDARRIGTDPWPTAP